MLLQLFQTALDKVTATSPYLTLKDMLLQLSQTALGKMKAIIPHFGLKDTLLQLSPHTLDIKQLEIYKKYCSCLVLLWAR